MELDLLQGTSLTKAKSGSSCEILVSISFSLLLIIKKLLVRSAIAVSSERSEPKGIGFLVLA